MVHRQINAGAASNTLTGPFANVLLGEVTCHLSYVQWSVEQWADKPGEFTQRK